MVDERRIRRNGIKTTGSAFLEADVSFARLVVRRFQLVFLVLDPHEDREAPPQPLIARYSFFS